MKHLTYKGYDIVLIRGGRKGSGSYAYLIHQGDEGRVVHMTMSLKTTTPMSVALTIKQDLYDAVTRDIEHRSWYAEYLKGLALV